MFLKKEVVMSNKLYKKTYSGWLATPGFFIFLLIFVIPTAASFYFGFCRWNLHTTTWTGFENFQQFFTMYNTKNAIPNTVVFALVGTFMKVVPGLLISVWLVNGSRTQNYLKSVLFMPSLLGSVVIAAAWSSIMEPTGILNQLLGTMGIEPIGWLTDKGWAMASIIFVDVWQGIGTTLVIYIGGLSAIPKTYYEAAAIDGVGPVQKFFKITLPLVVPSINSVLTLSLIHGFKHYELVMSLTNGGPAFSTEVIGSAVYKLFSSANYGIATTGYLIIFVVASCIVIPINRWVASRVEEF